jgi:hypothetical protein
VKPVRRRQASRSNDLIARIERSAYCIANRQRAPFPFDASDNGRIQRCAGRLDVAWCCGVSGVVVGDAFLFAERGGGGGDAECAFGSVLGGVRRGEANECEADAADAADFLVRLERLGEVFAPSTAVGAARNR